jgi:hypothetical protein
MPLRVAPVIDLVVTDIPATTGKVLSRELLKPDLLLILCTGFNKTPDETRTRSERHPQIHHETGRFS